MRILAMLACMAMAMLTIPPVDAATTAKVVGTWPAGDPVTLGQNQSFYLHVRYHSDEPIHIWAKPYGDGGSVHAGTNTSRIYPAGDGDALVWFFFLQPDERVTGVRITAGDGSAAGTREVANYPVEVWSGNEPATSQASPEWVTRLRREDKAAQDAAFQESMNKPVSAGDMLLFQGFMLLVAVLGILSFAGPAWGLWRWRGAWRIAAALPAAIMGFVVMRIIVDGARDPTSHNLWPFEILQAGVLSVVILILLVLARKLTGAGRAG